MGLGVGGGGKWVDRAVTKGAGDFLRLLSYGTKRNWNQKNFLAGQ